MTELLTIPRNTVLQGDVLERLRELPADCVDVAVTSPPYWGLRDYGDVKQIGLENNPAEYIAKIAAVGQEIRRVLKPSGSFWLNLGDTYFGGNGQCCRPKDWGDLEVSRIQAHAPADFIRERNKQRSNWMQPKQKMLIPARVAIALQDQGWILRNEIIWHKLNHMPESVTNRLTRSYESIYFFVKSPEYFSNLDAIREESHTVPWTVKPSPKTVKGNDPRKNYAGKFNELNAETMGSPRARVVTREMVNFYNPKGKNPGDVWSLTNEGISEEHFAAYPQKLVKRILSFACPKGGLVLDPFAGSGTSLLVAHKMGFDWLGIELVPKYVEIINKRIERHGKVRLDGFLACNQPRSAN